MAGSCSATQVTSGGKAKLGTAAEASDKKLTSGGPRRAARKTRHKRANSIGAFLTPRLELHLPGSLKASGHENGPGDAGALPFERCGAILGPRLGSLDYFRRRDPRSVLAGLRAVAKLLMPIQLATMPSTLAGMLNSKAAI